MATPQTLDQMRKALVLQQQSLNKHLEQIEVMRAETGLMMMQLEAIKQASVDKLPPVKDRFSANTNKGNTDHTVYL